MQQPTNSNAHILALAKQELWEEISLPTNNPALKKAIELHQVGLVEAIINDDYDLALRRATFNNIKDIVPLLLPKIKDINSTSSKQKHRSALHFAAMHGDKDVVQLILNAGAYINLDDEDRNTPLHLACEKGHYELATLLLVHRAIVTKNRMQQLPRGLESNSNIARTDELQSCIAFAKARTQQKSVQRPLSPSERWVLVPQICCVTSIPSNPHFKECLLQVLERNKINYLTMPQMIALEAESNANLTTVITQGLRYRENALCLNIAAEKLNNFFSLIKHKICLEKYFGTQFELIFTNYNKSDQCFFKAPEKISLEKFVGIDSSLYQFDKTNNCLLISNKNLPALLACIPNSADVNVWTEAQKPILNK